MSFKSRSAMFYVLVGCGLFVGALVVYKAIAISIAIAQSGKFAPPPDAISTLKVAVEKWEPSIDVVGSLEAIEGVTISAEEAGRVAAIHFEPGSDVKQGAILVQLDVSVEQAGLRSAQAAAKLAKLNFDRVHALVQRKLSPQADLDTTSSQLEQAVAAENEMKARIARKTIVAPFDGRTGIREVSLGEYVTAGQAIVPLFRVDALYLNLAIPQQAVEKVALENKVRFTVDSYPGEEFFGVVTGINPQVDQSNRNVRVQATVKNTQGKLRSGMFVSANIILPESHEYITVPATAISYAPYGNSVYVIEKQTSPEGVESLTVRQQFVQTGQTRGDQVAVTKGLQPGDEIATSGVFKLRPGASIQVNNSIHPKNEANPNPADI